MCEGIGFVLVPMFSVMKQNAQLTDEAKALEARTPVPFASVPFVSIVPSASGGLC